MIPLYITTSKKSSEAKLEFPLFQKAPKNLAKAGVYKKSKKQIQDLIVWLEGRMFPVDGVKVTSPQYAWRMGNNKALEDVIALLKYDGEYKDNTDEIIKILTQDTKGT